MVSLLPVQRQLSQPSQPPKPTKPLLRRATLSGSVRKSDDAELDADSLSVPPSPSKRARVSFNPNVEEKVMEVHAVKGRSFESVRGEVKRALEAHARGDSAGYDVIKQVFTKDKTDNGEEEEEEGPDDRAAEQKDEIKTYLLALTSQVSMLQRNCSGLIRVVLEFDWMGRDEGFVKSYVHFLGNLASAHGERCVGMVLGMLVQEFLGVRTSSGRLPGYPNVTRRQLYARVHMALKYLLRLIPASSAFLSRILSTKFPFSEESKKVHVTYIDNLIRLMEYAPELKSDILALITDRLVKIDVQMQVDLGNMDDEVAAAIVQAMSMDSPIHEKEDGVEDSEDSDADSMISEDELDEDSRRAKEAQANIEKMDAILDLLFTIYEPYFSDPNSIEATSMFHTLLGHFSNIRLPTYKSRHTQFLLFHFAQTAEHLVDSFAGTCVELAFQPSRPAVLRQSSAAYLASFVARGAHVPPHVVLTVFQVIGANLELVRSENELTCRGPDVRRYGTFYALTQALLYVFCFRWRDLIVSTDAFDDDDPAAFLSHDIEWAPTVYKTLKDTIYSKLNPLKICSPSIVSEFAKIARHLRFMYVYPLLETNKRIRLSQFSVGQDNGAIRDTGNGESSESWHQLDMYFPFDPYHLPVSRRWVDGDYVKWKGVPGLNQEDDGDEESAEEDLDDEEVDLDDQETGTDDNNDE